ncbi:hypothetical protein [Extensimonas vulgaris]|uniref:Major capsid protein E n=1 Tax=Extensimonas vulgaris TaxID=1031594 RepID=A0A369ANS1_9BURK|nr:hypothetical protein [Extensimonas vulgaris]RCX10703.1 hypothetical protein DFR45_102104 [Extensimonas vulgaris]TWI41345.1 hypothetical protein IP95_00102 [Extensimonas vulgaris]TXD16814.1 hypothetical protein FUT63_02145 [Extensimonas vulgaris]
MGRLSKLRIVDPVLTNLAIGYSNDQFVGDALMPFVLVDKEGGKIPVFGKEHFKLYATERALRAKSNRIAPEDIGAIDIALDEHDLEYPIDYREDAESAFPLQARATAVVTEGIRLRHEVMVATLAQNPASYPTGNKIALSGTSQFTDVANSDPEGVITDAKAAVRAKIVREPNTMVIGYAAWMALKKHPKLRAILSDTRQRVLQLNDLRDIFEIPNIYVGRAVTANDAGVVSDVWGDNIVLAYVPQTDMAQRSPYEPSYGYTLRRRGQPVVDTRTEDGKIELIRNTDIFRPYLLGADAGYLISNTNA